MSEAKLSDGDVYDCEVSIEWYPGRATDVRCISLLDVAAGTLYSRVMEYLIPLDCIPDTVRDKMAALDIVREGDVAGVGGVDTCNVRIDDDNPAAGTERLITYDIAITTLTEAQALADAINMYGEKK